MTPQEVVILARYVRALCPQQRFDEYTPDAWHDVLGEYRLDDARRAAAAVAKRQPFVSPSEIIAEIRQTRDAADADTVGPGLSAAIPDADPDDVEGYLAALREQRARAADGRQLEQRPVAALLAGVGRTVPADNLPEVKRPGPHGQTCPRCDAPIGRPCRLPSGAERATPHPARVRVALGQPATTETQQDIERRRTAAQGHAEDGAR